MVHDDAGSGDKPIMAEEERRELPHLFKLRLANNLASSGNGRPRQRIGTVYREHAGADAPVLSSGIGEAEPMIDKS